MILFSFSVKAKEVQLLCLYASSSKESQLRTLVGNCSETCNQALYCSRESNKVCMQEEGHTTKCIKENQIYFVLELLLVVQELKRTQRSDDRSAKFLISLWFVSKLLNLGFLCNFFFAAFFAAVASEAEVGFLFTLSFTTIFCKRTRKKQS